MTQQSLALEPVRVLITGSRRWRDRLKLERELIAEAIAICRERRDVPLVDEAAEWLARAPQHAIFIVGDCPDGADAIAFAWCRQPWPGVPALSISQFCARPDLPSPQRFHERNQAMVDEGRPDRFVAFWEGDRRDGEADGTLDTMRRCVRAGVPGRIVPA